MTETDNSESDILHPGQENLAPPWEVFPTYDRHSLGCRMGTGLD